MISITQLKALGLSGSGIRGRVARGALHRVHRGVYAVGHPLLGAKGRWMAAVLACGPGALLSHRSAAALWELSETGTLIDVTARRRAGRYRAGIRVHSAASIADRDVQLVGGIPCTTVGRTLLDLAELVGRRELERCVERAERLSLFDARAVDDVLSRAAGRAGTAALAAALEAWRPEIEPTHSELERRFLELCADAGVPRPQTNAWLPLPKGGLEVDFLWRPARVIAETDGHRFHGSRAAFERDRQRDQRLLLAGYRVVRFTWRQLTDEHDQVAATLRALVAS